MKLVLEPVGVEAEDGVPRRITWRRRAWPVDEIQDRWKWRGRWWRDSSLEGESRDYFRVVSRGSTLEVYRAGEEWILSRVWD